MRLYPSENYVKLQFKSDGIIKNIKVYHGKKCELRLKKKLITPQKRSQNMKFQTLSLKQQSLTLLSVTLGASLLATNPAMAVKKVIETKDTYLAPHRAVYDLKIGRAHV